MEDQDRVNTARSLLQRSVERGIKLRNHYKSEPLAGSPLAEELRTVDVELSGEWGRAPNDGPLRQAYYTSLACLASVDQLSQAACVISQTSLGVAPDVLARAAIETAARAWWLLDPTIDGRERIARGMTERIYSLREIIKVLDHMAPDEIQKREATLMRIEKASRAKDIRPIFDQKDRLVALEKRRPDATTLVNEFYRPNSTNLGAIGTVASQLVGTVRCGVCTATCSAFRALGLAEFSSRQRANL